MERRTVFGPIGIVRTSQKVADAIRKTIFDGTFRPGETLPPERTLAERFQVTRNTVREALRMLEQARLVTIRHGSGVRVLDYLTTTGLEFLAELLAAEAPRDKGLMDDMMDVRVVLGQAMLHHAMDRFTAGDAPSVRQAVEEFIVQAKTDPSDVGRLQELEFEIHNRIIQASRNRAFILLHNSLGQAYRRIAFLFEPLVEEPLKLAGRYEEMMESLEQGKLDRAKAIISRVLLSGSLRSKPGRGGRKPRKTRRPRHREEG